MTFDAVGSLILNNSLFGIGIVFGLIGVALGIARGLTRSTSQFPLIFAMITWVFGIILIPTLVHSLLLFSLGTIALMIAYLSELDSFGESDIWKTVTLILALNLALSVGLTLHDNNRGYPTNLNETDYLSSGTAIWVQSTEDEMEKRMEVLSGTGIYTGNPEDFANDISDRGDQQTGFEDFTVLLFKAAIWSAKMVKFMVTFLFTPMLIAARMDLIGAGNPILTMIIGIILNLIVIICIIQIIHFVLNKRGKGNG